MAINIQKNLLSINNYSRPGIKLKSVRGIVVHWVANPNTSALANRNFFENRKYCETGYGSAHYIIDLDGKVIQCIPLSEMAYHVGAKSYKKDAVEKLGSYPNNSTLGIECTHIDWNGRMTDETYNTLIELCKDLCMIYKLNPLTDLYRHYDITGKNCHKWFVDNPKEWEKFKKEVKNKIEGINNQRKIKFDFQGKKFETAGLFEDGTNYVAARELLENLGFNVSWDNTNKTVVIKKG